MVEQRVLAVVRNKVVLLVRIVDVISERMLVEIRLLQSIIVPYPRASDDKVFLPPIDRSR